MTVTIDQPPRRPDGAAARVLRRPPDRRPATRRDRRRAAGTHLPRAGRGGAACSRPTAGRRPPRRARASISSRRSSAAPRRRGRSPPRTLDVADRARAYQAGGASIISVLVEPHWFGGSIDGPAWPPVPRPRSRSWPRSSWSTRGSCPSCGPRARTRCCCSPRSTGAPRSRGWCAGRSTWASSRSSRSHDAQGAGRRARHGRAPHRRQQPRPADARRGHRDRRDAARPASPTTASSSPSRGVRETGPAPPLARRSASTPRSSGEELMRQGSDPAAVTARVAAFVAAGRQPRRGQDPATDGRVPFVKICGVTEPRGLRAAIAAGADAIGLNMVPGHEAGARRRRRRRRSSRRRADHRARPVARSSWASSPTRTRPRWPRSPARLGLDAVQLHGAEPPEALDRIPLPVIKALHLPRRGRGGAADRGRRSRPRSSRGPSAYRAQPNLRAILLDTADPTVKGGTGRAPPRTSRRRSPPGSRSSSPAASTPANVGEALLGRPRHRRGHRGRRGAAPGASPAARPRTPCAWPVRQACPGRPPRPARASRSVPARSTRASLEPDAAGRWGTDRQFGGRFVPETLMAALLDLEEAYEQIRREPAFWAELRELGRRYHRSAHRPLSRGPPGRGAGASCRAAPEGRLRLYLKREDLNHTGAHKINNALGPDAAHPAPGQVAGSSRRPAPASTAWRRPPRARCWTSSAWSTWARRTSVARPRTCSGCVRWAPRCARSPRARRRSRTPSTRRCATGSRTSPPPTTCSGSAVGPHPYPVLVRDLQRVIGDEAAAQMHRGRGPAAGRRDRVRRRRLQRHRPAGALHR